jgi:hypothetical protein
MDHFKGESYVRITADDIHSALESLGLSKTPTLRIPIGGVCRRCYAFPSIAGLRHMLKKQNWLTEEDEELPV